MFSEKHANELLPEFQYIILQSETSWKKATKKQQQQPPSFYNFIHKFTKNDFK